MGDRFTTRKSTNERRASLTCKTYEVKIDISKLSGKTKRELEQLFHEARWFYNYCVGLDDLNTADTTSKSVPVKTLDGFEDRKLQQLPGAVKQAIKTRMWSNIKALSTKKKQGNKIGRLKFKSQLDSVPLRQHGMGGGTYFINRVKSSLKVQTIKQPLKVKGLEQIPTEAEIANANLIKRDADYWINITTYTAVKPATPPDASIGVDLGCGAQLTLSDGTKIEFEVPVSKRIRQLDRKIQKHNRPNSKNKQKDYNFRRKAYSKLTNIKQDITNKVVSAITRTHKYVSIQDDCIKAWQSGNHGKKIQNTSIGGIKAALMSRAHTPLLVDRWFPSTQLCPECGAKHKHERGVSVYYCADCGYNADRDIKAAKMIEREGMKQVPTEHREVKLGENQSSTLLDLLDKIQHIRVSKTDSLSQEAYSESCL